MTFSTFIKIVEILVVVIGVILTQLFGINWAIGTILCYLILNLPAVWALIPRRADE